jgi:hypothetical protein
MVAELGLRLAHTLDSRNSREVFDRDPNYGTNQDPVVRGTAGEVRKRLAQYDTGTGSADAVRIDIPTGTWVPEVRVEPVTQPSDRR